MAEKLNEILIALKAQGFEEFVQRTKRGQKAVDDLALALKLTGQVSARGITETTKQMLKTGQVSQKTADKILEVAKVLRSFEQIIGGKNLKEFQSNLQRSLVALTSTGRAAERAKKDIEKLSTSTSDVKIKVTTFLDSKGLDKQVEKLQKDTQKKQIKLPIKEEIVKSEKPKIEKVQPKVEKTKETIKKAEPKEVKKPEVEVKPKIDKPKKIVQEVDLKPKIDKKESFELTRSQLEKQIGLEKVDSKKDPLIRTLHENARNLLSANKALEKHILDIIRKADKSKSINLASQQFEQSLSKKQKELIDKAGTTPQVVFGRAVKDTGQDLQFKKPKDLQSDLHFQSIAKAIAEGKEVPKEVLKEYERYSKLLNLATEEHRKSTKAISEERKARQKPITEPLSKRIVTRGNQKFLDDELIPKQDLSLTRKVLNSSKGLQADLEKNKKTIPEVKAGLEELAKKAASITLPNLAKAVQFTLKKVIDQLPSEEVKVPDKKPIKAKGTHQPDPRTPKLEAAFDDKTQKKFQKKVESIEFDDRARPKFEGKLISEKDLHLAIEAAARFQLINKGLKEGTIDAKRFRDEVAKFAQILGLLKSEKLQVGLIESFPTKEQARLSKQIAQAPKVPLQDSVSPQESERQRRESEKVRKIADKESGVTAKKEANELEERLTFFLKQAKKNAEIVSPDQIANAKAIKEEIAELSRHFRKGVIDANIFTSGIKAIKDKVISASTEQKDISAIDKDIRLQQPSFDVASQRLKEKVQSKDFAFGVDEQTKKDFETVSAFPDTGKRLEVLQDIGIELNKQIRTQGLNVKLVDKEILQGKQLLDIEQLQTQEGTKQLSNEAKRALLLQRQQQFVRETKSAIIGTATQETGKISSEKDIPGGPELFGRADEAINQNRQLAEAQNAHERAAAKLKTTQDNLNKSIETAVFKLIRYRIAFFAMSGAIQAVRDSIRVFAELSSKIAQLQIVIDPLTSSISELRRQSFSMAQGFGTSVSGVIDAFKIWAQAGLEQNEVLEATKATLIGVNAIGLDAKEITESLTASIFTYNNAISESIGVLSKWLAVEREFPVSAADLANAIKIVGSAGQVVGVTIDDLNGFIVAIGSATRKSGVAVAQSIKTMFAELPKKEAIQAFENIGISVLKTADEFRDFDDVLLDLHKKWDTLTSVQKTNLSITLAGVRRFSDFVALMDNYDKKIAATAISQGAFDEAIQASNIQLLTLSKAMESAGAAIDKVQFLFGESLAPAVQGVANIIKTLSNSSGFIGFITKAGAAIATLLGIVTVLGTTLIGTRFVFSLLIRKLKEYVNQVREVGAATQANSLIINQFGNSVAGAATKISIFSKVMRNMNIVLAALSILASIIGTVFLLNTEKIGITTDAMEDFGDAAEEAFSKTKSQLGSLVSQKDLLDGITEKLEKTEKAFNDSGKGSKEYEDNVASLIQKLGTLPEKNIAIVSSMADLAAGNKVTAETFATLKESISAVTNTVDTNTEATKKNLDAQKEALIAKLASQIEDKKKSGEQFALGLEVNKEQIDKIVSDFKKQTTGLDKRIKSAVGNIILPVESSFDLSEDFVKDPDAIENTIKDTLTKAVTDINTFVDKNFSPDIAKLLKVDFSETSDLQNQFGKLIAFLRTKSKQIQNLSGETRIAAINEFEKAIVDFQSTALKNINILGKEKEVAAILGQELIELNSKKKKLEEVEPLDSGFLIGDKLSDEVAEAISEFDNLVVEFDKVEDRFIELQHTIKFGDFAPDFEEFNFDSSKKFVESQINFIDKLSDRIRRLKQDRADLLDAQLALNNNQDLTGKRFEGTIVASKVLGEENQQEVVAEQLKTTLSTLEGLEAVLGRVKRSDPFKEAITNIIEYNRHLLESSRTAQEYERAISPVEKILEAQLDILSKYPNKIDVIADKEKELLGLEIDKEKKIADTLEQQEKNKKLLDINKKQFEGIVRILEKQRDAKINKILIRAIRNAELLKDTISNAFNNIPTNILEGSEKRRDIQDEIKEQELELQEAIKEGNQDSINATRERMKVLQEELKDYRKGWFEIRNIVLDIFDSVSSTFWKQLTEKFAEDISNITIGSETLGDTISENMAVATTNLTNNWRDTATEVNNKFFDEYRNILNQFLEVERSIKEASFVDPLTVTKTPVEELSKKSPAALDITKSIFSEKLLDLEQQLLSTTKESNDLLSLNNKTFQDYTKESTNADKKLMERLFDKYGDIIRKAAKDNNIDPVVLAARIAVESSGKEDARPIKDGKILSSAVGMGQLILSTAKEMGLDTATSTRDKVDPRDERLDPSKNIFAAAKYLGKQIEEFGDTVSGIAAFHAGPGTIEKFKEGKKDLDSDVIKGIDRTKRFASTMMDEKDFNREFGQPINKPVQVEVVNSVIDPSKVTEPIKIDLSGSKKERIIPEDRESKRKFSDALDKPEDTKEQTELKSKIIELKTAIEMLTVAIETIEKQTGDIVDIVLTDERDDKVLEDNTTATEKNNDLLNTLHSGMQILAASFATALTGTKNKGAQVGAGFGSAIGASFGEKTLGPKVFEKVFGSTVGSILGGPVGTFLGGAIGGLFGGLFGGSKKKEKKFEKAIDRNTEAVNNNTLALKQLDKAIFNAPTSFNVPAFGGGGFGRTVQITINASNPAEVARSVRRALDSDYTVESRSHGTRGYSSI